MTMLCAVEKTRKPKMGDALREREQNQKWFEAPICQRKKEARRAERQTETVRERQNEGEGGVDKLKTARGCTDTDCETDNKKETKGVKRRSAETEEADRDRKRE